MTRKNLIIGMIPSGVLALSALAALFLLGGCTMPSVRSYEAIYSLDGWRLTYADPETISYHCKGNKKGCADTGRKMIYCGQDDYASCGHELRHISAGNYHK